MAGRGRDPWIFTIAEAARALEIDRATMARRLKDLEPDDYDGRSKYYRLKRIIDHLYRPPPGDDADDQPLILDLERARLARAQTTKHELEIATLRGELIPVRAAAVLLEEIVKAIRSRLLSLPTTAAPRVIGKRKLREVKAQLETVIRDALAELASLDVRRLGRLDDSGRVTGGRDDVRAAAAPVRQRVGRRTKASKSRK